MPSVDTLRNNIVNEYYSNSILLNVAINIEKFLYEDVILYPYKGWEYGEIIAGPFLHKYFVSIILRYEYEDMPDPDAITVFKRYGVVCQYKKIKETWMVKKDAHQNPEKEQKEAWYVQLDIPRELVSDNRQRDELRTIEHLLDIENIENMSDDNQETGEFSDDSFGTSLDSDIDFSEPEVTDTNTGEEDA